ncbi:MAG: PEP-CTERM sorting domain-containing protein [Proteobacteria bacterium]|nr:PEP-CTERM sorting domain-containing protein [Burkholderiales bacterium]
MKVSLLSRALVGAGMLATAGMSHAFLTTTLFNPTDVVTFESFDGFVTTGPTALSGFTTFAPSSTSTLGAFIADLGGNGIWGVGKVFAGLGSFFDPVVPGTMSFSFNGAFATAGAFLNTFSPNGVITISAFGVGGLLETHDVVIDTPGGENAGVFYGIGRSSAEITSISFSGTGVVLDDLAISTAVVPLPAATWLLGGGLMLLGLVGRRGKRAV